MESSDHSAVIIFILRLLLLCLEANKVSSEPTVGDLEDFCYFQSPSERAALCGWYSADDQLPWIHTNKPTKQEIRAGLTNDFSPSTDGYFLVARSINTNQTSSYDLLKNVSGGEGRVFTFGIHMSGEGGTITVKIRNIADTQGYRNVYNISGNQGKWWVESEDVPIADCNDYQIMISAVIREGTTTSIALDDFLFNDDRKVRPLQPGPGIPRDKLCWNGAKYILDVDGRRDHVCCCEPGFTGVFCQTNIDECSENMCMNGATCLDQVNGYQCHCADDFEGSFCQSAIDDCKGVTCLNSGVCQDRIKDYYCMCTAGYTGKRCEIQLDICECRNGGTCIRREKNRPVCSCPSGYSGDFCEEDISECTRRGNPCGPLATCLDGRGPEYLCICPPGETAVIASGIIKCEDAFDSCASHPCLYGGVCEDTRLGFKCHCLVGTEGYRCQTNTDDCAAVDCQNGGTCKDEINSHRCECNTGFIGKDCETDIRNKICMENCESKKTKDCTFDEGRLKCNCIKGFTGSKCQHRLQQCDSNPCVRGICTERPIGYICGCEYGWTGQNCHKKVDFCPAIECGEHGKCLNTNDGPRCKCDPDYTGPRCSKKIDPCDTARCQNGGKCVAIYEPFRPYKCECTSSLYVGKYCEIELVLPTPISAQSQQAIIQQTNTCVDFWALPRDLKGTILIISIAVNVAVLASGLIIIELCARSARLRQQERRLNSTGRFSDGLSNSYRK